VPALAYLMRMLKTLAMPLMMAFRIPAMPLTIALRQAPTERKRALMLDGMLVVVTCEQETRSLPADDGAHFDDGEVVVGGGVVEFGKWCQSWRGTCQTQWNE
jgi:hypothetical protein